MGTGSCACLCPADENIDRKENYKIKKEIDFA